MSEPNEEKEQSRKVPERQNEAPEADGVEVEQGIIEEVVPEPEQEVVQEPEQTPAPEPENPDGLLLTATFRVYENRIMEADFVIPPGQIVETKHVNKIVTKIKPLWMKYCREVRRQDAK